LAPQLQLEQLEQELALGQEGIGIDADIFTNLKELNSGVGTETFANHPTKWNPREIVSRTFGTDLHRCLRDDMKSEVPPRDGHTHHSDAQQTKLRAHQSSLAHRFLLQHHGGDDGCCDSEYGADLTRHRSLVDRYRAVDTNGWPQTWHRARQVR
jgi:hypothetical protein